MGQRARRRPRKAVRVPRSLRSLREPLRQKDGTEQIGLDPDGRRFPRSPRPVTASAGFSPALARAGFRRVSTDVCVSVSRSHRRAVRGLQSDSHRRLPSSSRSPLSRTPVLGLLPRPPRWSSTGPLRSSFGTCVLATVLPILRFWPLLRSVSTCRVDPGRSVRCVPDCSVGTAWYVLTDINRCGSGSSSGSSRCHHPFPGRFRPGRVSAGSVRNTGKRSEPTASYGLL